MYEAFCGLPANVCVCVRMCILYEKVHYTVRKSHISNCFMDGQPHKSLIEKGFE